LQSVRPLVALAAVSDGPPDQSAPASKPAPAAPGPRRKRHRIRNGLLILLAALVLFHRPLLIALIHAEAVHIAAEQNVRLSVEVDGTIFTNLSLRNISATPNGRGPTPVDNISIEEMTVRYSVLSLLRHGESEFLQSYTLRNAIISVKPVEGTSEQKSDLASTLHDLIQQPALFSDRVEIDNLNLVAHVPDGEFAVKGLSLLLDPVESGSMKIAVLQIPKIRTWRDLSATTSYADRDMILRGLELDPQIVVQRFELDASQRAEGINRLAVQGNFFGGAADFSLLVKELPGKHENNVSNALAQVDSTVTDLSLEKVSQYFGEGAPAVGSLSDASMHLSGDPNTPASWTGTMSAVAGAVRAGDFVMDKAVTWLDASKGWATFGATLFSGSNSISAQAEGKLPDSLDGFAGSVIDGWFYVAGDDPHHLVTDISSGKVNGSGTFDLRDNSLRAGLDMKATDLYGNSVEVASGDFHAEMTKAFSSGSGGTFDGLAIEAHGRGAELRAGDYALDSAAVDFSLEDGVARFENVAATRAQNSLAASGTYWLPRDLASAGSAPASFQFSVQAPSIAAFRAEPNLNGPDGNLEAGGSVTNGPSGWNGAISGSASDLRMRDFAAQGFEFGVTIRNSVAAIDTLRFALNPTDGFSASGHVDLQKPYSYDGILKAQIRDLSKFNALVPSLKGGVAGALGLDWQGEGDLDTLASTGSLNFSLRNGRVADVHAINAAIAGSYNPEEIDFPSFSVTSSLGAVSAVIAANNNVLRVNNISVKQAGRTLLTGGAALPLDLHTPAQPETLIPSNGPIFADLVSGEIALESFFPRGKAPATGVAKITIAARGTIDQPEAHVVVSGRNLQAAAAATLAPAALDAEFSLIGDQLCLKARIAQPSISPIDISGTVPLPLKECLRNGYVDTNSPVRLSVRMPSSSLSFVTRIVPAVRYIQGTAQASVDVAGTIAKPVLSGAALVDLQAVRLTDPTMPSISGFRADMRFAGDQLTLQQFSGNLSGGQFTMTGGVLFNSLVNPTISLHFVSKGDLVMRNEAVTVRTDSDIRVLGPLSAASVIGDVGITKSRFFKEIEILPLELPGRPAPAPPSIPGPPSINIPPFNNWKFALKIHTKDPFIIQGNLANGQALIDLNLGGTGKAPTLDGTVRIENFVASLPFSKLRVTNGFVYFSKDDPFMPQLNIQASSTLQDYNINVFIYGAASDPKTVLSSEPPLPQEDIVALLATGATASNLSSGNALAGRAAILLFQQIYHKIFKAKPPSDNESFMSRFKVDVGAVDPRTGQQEIRSSFQLSPDFYLIGELDVGGDIRGMVQYLLRFK